MNRCARDTWSQGGLLGPGDCGVEANVMVWESAGYGLVITRPRPAEEVWSRKCLVKGGFCGPVWTRLCCGRIDK